ncbi:M20 family metallo-hydrolase [Bradyrhizobium sp. NP1]|uniref:M20 family metallo-hydrolase n=1 Tax=Bradyrhizobium sp. NP1 TaxID=3049772 RepID=UPI0025A61124|nr:M20 family metallo-hydrolase [Bradyrhizobium sp. NP1]WJR80851.1 M20 family metallo-hydrolase [Bradyrhizobium sp. NP1]
MADIDHFIDGARLWARHEALATFGATPAGGVDRPALSRAEIDARAQLMTWAAAIGLQPSTDDIANLFLRLPGRDPDLPPVLVGSHIDSQPTGGKYDGVYGVLAGLECLEAIVAAGAKPRRSIELVCWTNEEGSRFAPGMMGSAAFAGKRRLEDILAVRDADGVTVAGALRAVRAAENALAHRPLGGTPAAYVEAHIEQGPILDMRSIPIGVVTGIQGKRTFRVRIVGEENHAGTSPRSARKDALMDSVRIVSALRDTFADPDDIVRFTVGMFTVRPNAPSVVPSEVEFSIDLRHPDTSALARLGDQVAPICKANSLTCEAEIRELIHDPPLEFPGPLREKIRLAAAARGLGHMEIPSGAGHDARYLHYICPTAMIFIPCWKGISHNENERITPADALAGARVLATLVLGLAGE